MIGQITICFDIFPDFPTSSLQEPYQAKKVKKALDVIFLVILEILNKQSSFRRKEIE
jgi:hypothetical protein